MAPRLGKGSKKADVEAPARRCAGDPRPLRRRSSSRWRPWPSTCRRSCAKPCSRCATEVEKNCEHVGDKFAEEARKIHYGESDKRGIYGETSDEEAEALADEGIEFGRLPWIPRGN